MKRILSLLIGAVMTAVLLATPAAAAGPAPWVEANGIGTSHLTISIRGLSGNYDSAQITLTLDEAPTGFTFDQTLCDEATHTRYTIDGNKVTLYVTSKNQINQGEAILLGALAGPTGFQVSSASDLILLDLDTGHMREVPYSRVDVGSTDGSGNTGGGNTGGGNTGGGNTGGGNIGGGNTGGGNTGGGNTGGGNTGGGNTGGGNTGGGTGGTTGADSTPFTDVKETDWFRDAVAYVYRAGLMNGTSFTAFSPQGTTTRGMIVTILYRYEGSPAVSGSAFLDVPAGQYYTDAVTWAAASGVVNGYSGGRFGPNDPITREQMAAILYRYASYKGLDVSGRADLSGYVDAGRISSYAREPMAWANQTGLIGGIGSHTLQPGGTATRAQVATILMRFCENIAK